jgi:large subunit ribosomal protein L15
MSEMPHKKRKVRKKRGSRTHGYGRVGQHRGGGQRGGHGKAGRQKHKWTYVVKYEPDYFGKHGFNPPRKRKVNVINVGKLDEKVSQLLREKKAVEEDDGVKVDLHQLGYDKLLGSGQITHRLIIKVASYSRSAEKKVKGAKGKIADSF